MEFRKGVLLLRRYPFLIKRLLNRSWDFGSVRKRFYQQYWRHAASVIGADITSLGDERYEISVGNRVTRVQYHYVNLDTYFNKQLADDKAWVSRQLESLGFRSPAFVEYDLRTIADAKGFLYRTGKACVVKPVSGSGGHGITTGIDRNRRLVEASLVASSSIQLPKLMLEQQIPGDSFRLLYLDGRLLHAVKRGRCSIIGDGQSTIGTLIDRENEHRLRADPATSLNEINFDLDAKYTLADQALRSNSLPACGERVVIKNVSNQNARRDQENVTDAVHPRYHELASILYEQLRFRLVGLDIMATDIASDPVSVGSAINEVNIPPGLHYHEIIESQSSFTDVGAEILTCLLREDRRSAPPGGTPLRVVAN
jgi:cyanophycin synthetase